MPTVNEIFIILTFLLDLAFILLMLRFGVAGILSAVIINMTLVSIFGAELMQIFGWTTNVGVVFYVAVGTGLAMTVEHYGRKEGEKIIWVTFSSIVALLLLGQIALWLTPIPESKTVGEALQFLFMMMPRLTFASLIAFLISQHLHVRVYEHIRTLTNGSSLWLRRLIAGTSGQIVDSVIFFSIGFIDVHSSVTFVEILVVGLIIKVALVILSVPFLYASYFFKPLIPRNTDGY